MTTLWRGYHSEALFQEIKSHWANDHLLIICPPTLKDFSFIRALPSGPVIVQNFPDDQRALISTETPSSPPYPEQPILGVFTSGTVSGKPRLVLYSKRNLEKSLEGILTFFDSSRITDIFCYPQPFHTFGLILGYVHALLYQRKLWIPEGKYSHHAHELRAGIKAPGLLTLGAPAHFHDLLAHTRKSGAALTPSYSCIIGGAKVSVALWKEIQTELHVQMPSIGYGATEASPGITHHPAGLCPKEEGEIGFPIPGVETQIIPGQGIEFSGENVCLAIIEGQSAQFPKGVLIRDEIEKRAEDQMLLYRGRNELILNRGGSKYSLEVLEHLFQSQLQLKAVCFGVPDVRLGEDLGILIESNPEVKEPALEKIRDQIKKILLESYGHHFELNHFMATEKIPLTDNGKIDRKKCAGVLKA